MAAGPLAGQSDRSQRQVWCPPPAALQRGKVAGRGTKGAPLLVDSTVGAHRVSTTAGRPRWPIWAPSSRMRVAMLASAGWLSASKNPACCGHDAKQPPWVCARPQDGPQAAAKTRRERRPLRRRHCFFPVEGAQPLQEPLLHGAFETVDIQIVAPVPRQPQVPREFLPVQRRNLRRAGDARTSARAAHGGSSR
jgi:hypothetical protein